MHRYFHCKFFPVLIIATAATSAAPSVLGQQRITDKAYALFVSTLTAAGF